MTLTTRGAGECARLCWCQWPVRTTRCCCLPFGHAHSAPGDDHPGEEPPHGGGAGAPSAQTCACGGELPLGHTLAHTHTHTHTHLQEFQLSYVPPVVTIPAHTHRAACPTRMHRAYDGGRGAEGGGHGEGRGKKYENEVLSPTCGADTALPSHLPASPMSKLRTVTNLAWCAGR